MRVHIIYDVRCHKIILDAILLTHAQYNVGVIIYIMPRWCHLLF